MKKRRSAEQIVGLLRQADVDLGKGAMVPDVCRRLGISQQTYYRWRTRLCWLGGVAAAAHESAIEAGMCGAYRRTRRGAVVPDHA